MRNDELGTTLLVCVESIPFNTPFISGNEEKYLSEVFQNGHFAGNGTFTKRCQRLLEEVTGSKILLTTSCTAALELSALAVDILPGDEIIVPSYTFVSTASAFLRAGAKIIFAEVDPSTLMLDLSDVKERTSNRTKAIVTVHYAGLPSDINNLLDYCQSTGIDLIEDAAQSFGTTTKNGHLGTFGRFGTISFHETKNIHCGLGGALIINNPDDFDRVENIWERGTNRTKMLRGTVDKYTWLEPGSSFYPTELQAAFLLAQLESLQENLSYRSKLTHEYLTKLEPLEDSGKLLVQKGGDYENWNHHAIVCIFPNNEITERVRISLKNKEINAYIGYVPLHSSPMGIKLGWDEDDLPVTADISNRVLRLPLHCEMSVNDVTLVCEEIASILK